ncbi:MAG: amidohydrolase family protein [Lachnospiraceae bacterium]|nr:amidohydrolase family protein [Lachnospiraceae bacterium]
MIIDFHTHTFPEKIAHRAVEELKGKSGTPAYTDGTNGDLLRKAKKAGVDLSVIQPVATSPSQVVSINDHAARVNEEYHNAGLLSFGCMHPDFSDYRSELKRIRENALPGIKLHPVYQGADLDDIRFLRVISCAAEQELMVLTHMGWDIGFPGVEHCSPRMAAHVLKEIGEFSFILAHMAGWKQWEEAKDCLAGTGVYLDTSVSVGRLHAAPGSSWSAEELQMLDTEGFLSMHRAFGGDRILFATDSPWSEQTEAISFIRELPLDNMQKEKILGKNAEDLLRKHKVRIYSSESSS